MTTKPPVCLTIGGLDPSGGAGIVADIKAFSAFGCFAAAAVTSVTFQNTTGVFGAVHQTGEDVRRQIEPVLDDFDVAAVKTGMLPTRDVIETVAAIIRERELKNVVVDPVVRSTSGFDLIDDAAFAKMKKGVRIINCARGGLVNEDALYDALKSGHVAGVFTDGDLRRALEKSIDIHTARIADLMGRNPKTIGPDQLAVEAVEKMQSLKINGLLVTTPDAKLAGALNMHDLLKAGVV